MRKVASGKGGHDGVSQCCCLRNITHYDSGRMLLILSMSTKHELNKRPWPKQADIDRLIDHVWRSRHIKDGEVESTGHLMQYAMLVGLQAIRDGRA